MADSPLVNDRIITSMCTPTNGRAVDLVVLHTLEYPERVGAARWAAGYFRTVQASANYCVDAQEIIGNVWEKDMPWTTPGVNERSISIEQAGYAGQSVSEWADAYSRAMLENTARLTADICKRNNIPPVLLSNAQLAAGHKGIIHHVQASEVYRLSDHWDCGPNFPWSYFMGRVAHYYGGGTGGIIPAVPPAPSIPETVVEYIMTMSKTEARDLIIEASEQGARQAFEKYKGWFEQRAWNAVQQNGGFIQDKAKAGAEAALNEPLTVEGTGEKGRTTTVPLEARYAVAGKVNQLAATRKEGDRIIARLDELAVSGGPVSGGWASAEALRKVIREELNATTLKGA